MGISCPAQIAEIHLSCFPPKTHSSGNKHTLHNFHFCEETPNLIIAIMIFLLSNNTFTFLFYRKFCVAIHSHGESIFSLLFAKQIQDFLRHNTGSHTCLHKTSTHQTGYYTLPEVRRRKQIEKARNNAKSSGICFPKVCLLSHTK